MFPVVVWVQVEFRSLSSFRRCMLFDWLLLFLLLSTFTFSCVCVQGRWVPSSKVCFSAMADCIIAKSPALNRALNAIKSLKPSFKTWIFRALWKALNCNFTMFFFVKAYGSHRTCQTTLHVNRQTERGKLKKIKQAKRQRKVKKKEP